MSYDELNTRGPLMQNEEFQDSGKLLQITVRIQLPQARNSYVQTSSCV